MLKVDRSKVLLEFNELYNRIELLEAEVAKKNGMPIKVNLVGGKYLLYAYICNGQIKFGTSFCNTHGERVKSHSTSVPNLSISFVIYSSKRNIKILDQAIKNMFCIEGRFEHINCSMPELETFVMGILDVYRFTYKKETDHKLRLLSIFLKS